MKTTSALRNALAVLTLAVFFASCEEEVFQPEIPNIPAVQVPVVGNPIGELPTPASLQEELAGRWNFTSYQIDGTEYMSFIVKSASLRFSAAMVEQGAFVQEVEFRSGERDVLNGRYEVDETNGKVTLRNGSRTIVAKVSIHNGNELIWEGTQDGLPLNIHATRQQ